MKHMAKAAAVTEETTERSLGANDPEFQASVVELRDEQEMKWGEIATELECTAGKALLAYLIATIKPKDQIKWKDDEDVLSAAIVKARDTDNLSWGFISAATRPYVAESKVRSLYTAATETDTRGLRIGKGGRYPGDENPNGDAPAKPAKKAPAKKVAAKKVAAKKAAPAKKAPAKKAAANKAPAAKAQIADMDLDQLKERLNGKTIMVQQGDRKVKIAVATVLGLENGELSFADKAKKNRTVVLTDIAGASR
jgi:hypothetical protein